MKISAEWGIERTGMTGKTPAETKVDRVSRETERMRKSLRVHKSGDYVPESGIYSVLHSTPHMLIEHQINFEGGRFRPCPTCPFGVLYRLENQCAATSRLDFRAPVLGTC